MRYFLTALVLSLPAMLVSQTTNAAPMGVHSTEYALKECRAYLKVSNGEQVNTNDMAIPVYVGSCGGYIRGVYETIMMEEASGKGSRSVCFPNHFPSLDQLVQIFVNYAQANPVNWDKPRITSTYLAFMEAYPCQ